MSDERPSVVCSGVLARACDGFRTAVNSSIVLRAACRSEHIAEMLWYVWQSAQAAEREACAQLCEQNLFYGLVPAEDGNAREYWNDAAQDCAGQIRKRTNDLALPTDSRAAVGRSAAAHGSAGAPGSEGDGQ